MPSRPRGCCLFVVLLAACSGRPELAPGEECELNSECDARLVCRIGRCRVECRAQRDCAAGLQCVRDELGLGACQLEEETRCANNSDCPESLICQFGRCTNECNDDRDCPSGARCEDGSAGMRACLDRAETECALNSDCGPNLICAVDNRCRVECRTDRDCRDGDRCRDDLFEVPVCAPPGGPDAGAGPADGGVDGGGVDGGGVDGGGVDGGAGTDAGIDGAAPPGMDAGMLDAGMLDAGAPDAGVPDAGAPDAGAPAMIPSWSILGSGRNHTCGTRASGETRCWGQNDRNQLGNGGPSPQPTPAALTVPGPVTRVAGGARHSCVATTMGLFCWGDNGARQLGVVGDPISTPTAVPGLPPSPVTDVALGNDHSCAIADARLFCWGGNEVGQLGLGDTMMRTSPVEVTPLPGTPVQVSTFSRTTCVRFSAGSVSCTGAGIEGQIGDGGGVNRTSLRPVSGLTDAVQIATGTTFACALRAGGTVVCWGNNFFGQLGNGGLLSSTTPTPTSPLPVVRQLAAGSGHACARTDTEVYCWGDNNDGQCGADPAMATSRSSPTAVAGLGAVDAVGVGFSHSCTRTGTSFSCFGENMNGQLGTGSSGAPTHLPQPVLWP